MKTLKVKEGYLEDEIIFECRKRKGKVISFRIKEGGADYYLEVLGKENVEKLRDFLKKEVK